MAVIALPSQEVLRQLLDYDPDTGALTWRRRGREWFTSGGGRTADQSASGWNKRFAGKAALATLGSDGYLRGPILGKMAASHRVIWKMVHGEDPTLIDHINGSRIDNRLANLRSVSRTENNRNKATRKTNTSGVQGVSWHKASGKWVVNVGADYCGLYSDKDEAIDARRRGEAARGYHRNNGRAA
jgi:hypothetical protein